MLKKIFNSFTDQNECIQNENRFSMIKEDENKCAQTGNR